MAINTLIMGAAGRDFHNFLTYFKNNKQYNVKCFTANQIPGISGKKFPKELSGSLYKNGIKIYDETELPYLIKSKKIELCVLSYSDLSNNEVMEKIAYVQTLGCDFMILGPDTTQLKSKKPIISVTAVRTGCGKSQITRHISKILSDKKIKHSIIRHPMPYGILKNQIFQKFKSFRDLNKYDLTIEEREEFEKHLENGATVYCGIDYKKILNDAEKNSSIIIWDGGNNDFEFYNSDLKIVVLDPLRKDNEIDYYPGLTNLMRADIAIINKINSANKTQINNCINNIKLKNKKAKIIMTESIYDTPRTNKKNILVIEDGPTTTHGNMSYGVAYLAAKKLNKNIIKPKKYASGYYKKIYENYKNLEYIIPAIGYNTNQIKDLKNMINKIKPDAIFSGSPIDIKKLLNLDIEVFNINYKIKDNKGIIKRYITTYLNK